MLSVYFELGFGHLTEAGAWDHQLFLATIALAYPAALWRRWVGLATAFALGHTASIVALALGGVPAGMPWVEPAIAASIVALAAYDLWRLRVDPLGVRSGFRQNPTTPSLVLAFGLVHGLGFGSAFVPVMTRGVGGGELAAGLAAFTLGVEAAQLLILSGLWAVAFALFDLWQWRPLFLRRALLICIALAGTAKLAALLSA